MSRLTRLEGLLNAALSPTSLEVIDESHKHAGHSGAREGGETHYHVVISSPKFQGKMLVAKHRLVNDAVKQEFENGLHALSIECKL
jgi:BolA family transcriptional regulator, general stress-responsive regulator